MTGTLPDLVTRVAEHALDRDMESEDWQKAVAIDGLLSAGGGEYVPAAKRLVDRAIETQTGEGQFSYGSLDPKPWSEDYQSQTDPAALGRPVLSFYERTDEERYLEAARRQYAYLRDTARRTADGGIAHHRGPIELWVDSIYMLCPFLAAYGAAADVPAAREEALDQIAVQAAHLQDPRTGLFRHEWRETPDSFPESTFWSRGNGWAAAGIVDTLALLPDGQPGREQAETVLRTLADAVVERQDGSGFWHNVLDDPASPLETSGTLMFAYAFERATAAGLLDDERSVAAAERAMDVCAGVVDEEGAVRRVVGPPGGPGVPFAVTSYGQGWFLLAASRFV